MNGIATGRRFSVQHSRFLYLTKLALRATIVAYDAVKHVCAEKF